MKLSEKQQLFSFNVAQLIISVYAMGYKVSMGEVFRTEDQQKIYVDKGLSQTMNSKHRDKLAIDFFLFIDGQYLTHTEDYKFMGLIWKELDDNNIWGGDWKTLKDANHFQYGK